MRARTVALLLASYAAVAGCGMAGMDPHPAARTGAPAALSAGTDVFPVSQRKPAPAMRGTTLTGARTSVRRLAGHRVVAVNVWASWCGPCRAEVPLLARADGHRLTVVGIDERDRADAARSFALSHGARYPSLVDPEGALLRRLQMLPQTGIPSTVFIDARGRIAARVIGPLDERSLRLVLEQIGTSS